MMETSKQIGTPASGGNKTTAFVFAGGGSLGAVQVGMMKAVVDRGIKPDFMVGASVGALNAALYASKPTPKGVDELETIWNRIRRTDIFPINPVNGVMALLGRRNHICRFQGLEQILHASPIVNRFNELEIPCYIVATEFFQGREMLLSEGSLQQALMATVAMPALFPPVLRDGYYLVDGGIANNTPISSAVELGAQKIIVFSTGVSCALERLPTSTMEMVLHSLNILIAKRLIRDIEVYREKVELWVIPPLCPLEVSLFDFSKSYQLMVHAEQSTRTWLSRQLEGRGEKPTESIPHQLIPHHHEPAKTAYC